MFRFFCGLDEDDDDIDDDDDDDIYIMMKCVYVCHATRFPLCSLRQLHSLPLSEQEGRFIILLIIKHYTFSILY